MKLKPHIYRGRFYNHHGESIKTYLKSILVTMRHMFKKRKPFFNKSKEDVLKEWVKIPSFNASSVSPAITWLGHATFLCQMGGYTIITDPIFGELSRLFPRMIPLPITLSEIPAIDVVLISHNHQDHLDLKSLNALKKYNPLFFVPQGNKKWFDQRGFSRIVEYSWWEEHTLPARKSMGPITIQFLPAHHWSGRGIFSINKSLWGSWLMADQSASIYFAGDTSYSDHFKIIGDACKKIDIALLPIGPCEPREGMQDSHINSEEALQAFVDLNAQHFIPMHWGTFRQGLDSFLCAPNQLTSLWEKRFLNTDKILHLAKFGETKTFPNPQTDDIL